MNAFTPSMNVALAPLANIANKTDSYKPSHYLQFAPNTKETFYYVSARVPEQFIRFYGLQMLIKKHFMQAPTQEQVEQAAMFWQQTGLPFNKEGWMKVAKLGYLPIEINALPEGAVYPGGVPLITVKNTLPEFYWMPGWIETLLMQIWYPTTVCTNSYNMRKAILEYLELTGTPEMIDFKLHDFGYRGATCQEAAEIGGSAHLVNFKGTDTFAGVLAAMSYYNTSDMLGFSIPAAEHSTMTSWGKDNEVDAYKNMLDQFAKPGSLVAVVSDSYDLYNAVENIWGGVLKEQIINSGATVVIRPDSGEPADVVLRVLQLLEEKFGVTKNEKYFKVLPPCVRIIQGDGIDNVESIKTILNRMAKFQYSADNIAFGMGGGLLQKCNRDTFKFAMKCSAVNNGKMWKGVSKNPVDAPWKASMAGVLDVTPEYKVVDKRGYSGPSALRTVFKNGMLLVDEDFQTIRNRA